MFVFRNGKVAVLLLVLAESCVLASYGDEKNELRAWAETLVNSMKTSRIDRIDSVIRSSESSCDEEIAALSAAIEAQESWALQMLDASSKIQSGIMKGNIQDLGMYDQCIEAYGHYNGTNVQGQYCKVSFDTGLSSAVCVPSTCNETDVLDLVGNFIESVTEIAGLELNISSVTCIPVGSEDFTIGEILTIIFFSSVGFFIIFCTICEFVKLSNPKRVSPAIHVLAKFSLYTNAMTLLSTKASPQMMPAIQGIRFLSTCWVVLGHRYVNTLLRPMVNLLDILDWYDSWTAIYIQAAPFAVDTFFVISGFLMSYMYLKSKKLGKRSNFHMAYIHRYLRLTPCIAVLMLFVAVLLHRVSNGPLWSSLLTVHVEPCRKNWWINLLYVQNLVKVDELCLLHSWYLAVDMQLFWISPIILYPLHRWPKYGLGLLSLFLVGSIVTPAVLLQMNGYSNAAIRFDGSLSEILDNFLYFYIPTYNRACAYFVGILLGYDAAKRKRHFTKMNVAINWTIATIFMLLCGLATQRVHNTVLGYDVNLETAFAVVLRPIWSIAIAWIVYACTFGYGGAVTRFLSLPIFLPLSRLSYCIYLVHMVIQTSKVTAEQTPARFLDFTVLNEFWADLVLSIAVAFIFSLFFESPVIVLKNLLTNRDRERRPTAKPKTDVEGGIDNKAMTVET